jgi:hypothetical protein
MSTKLKSENQTIVKGNNLTMVERLKSLQTKGKEIVESFTVSANQRFQGINVSQFMFLLIAIFGEISFKELHKLTQTYHRKSRGKDGKPNNFGVSDRTTKKEFGVAKSVEQNGHLKYAFPAMSSHTDDQSNEPVTELQNVLIYNDIEKASKYYLDINNKVIKEKRASNPTFLRFEGNLQDVKTWLIRELIEQGAKPERAKQMVNYMVENRVFIDSGDIIES